MTKGKRFLSSISDLVFFLSILVGTISLIWTVIEILEYFGIDLQFLKSGKGLSIYLIVIHGVLFGVAGVYLRMLLGDHPPSADREERESILADELIESLRTALNSKKYSEVIRIGSALGKPLFASGNYRTRLQIGLLVEEAAAATNDEHTQMVELIDSIGWMHVELGDMENGEKNILHGLEFARKLNDKFYISKANRHLGSICRRRGEYERALMLHNESLKLANQVTNAAKKAEALSATHYAMSILYYHKNDYNNSLSYADLALEGFTKLKRSDKIAMSLISKAQTCLALNKTVEAKDLFRKALNISEQNTLRLEMVRCYLGLARVFVKENNWTKAEECLDKSEEVERGVHSANEIAEISKLRSQIKNRKASGA